MSNKQSSITPMMAYKQFEALSYDILDANGGASIIFNSDAATHTLNLVREASADLYTQHKGDPVWELAYQRWCSTL